jgi:YidC/Oxa1 family membrane protein insertase
VLESLATPVGIILRTIHDGLSTFLDPASGLAWGLSIVLLTILVRLVLFPLFVKQIKSQRRMQELAPLIKELQKKHKGDRETLNTEMMKLYKENNANPIAGCLPLLLQLPVFFALFHVIRHFGSDREPRYGLTSQQLEEGGLAQVFGAPISANFRSSAAELAELGAGSPTTVRIVAAIMVVLMGATTFWTQRQMIARSNTTDPQQIMIQKFMLYVLPLTFAVSGVIFPIGVLLYWLTTNVWSMGQQAYVIKRMPPVSTASLTGGSRPASGDAKPAKGKAGGDAAPDAGSDGAPAKGKRRKRPAGPAAADADADAKAAADKADQGAGGSPEQEAGESAAPSEPAGRPAGEGAGGSGRSGGPGSGSGSGGSVPLSGRPARATPPAAVSAAPKRRPDGSRKNKNRRGGRR